MHSLLYGMGNYTNNGTYKILPCNFGIEIW